MIVKEAIVVEKVWGPDDTYLTVEVQVDSSQFKRGDKVEVMVRKKNVKGENKW